MSGKNGHIRPDDAGIAQAAQILRDGGLVAIPTETVYGLAGRADSAQSVAAIYRTKGRPDFNPLIVHVSSIEMARQLANFDAMAERLAAAYWPGPLTLVLPVRADAPVTKAVTAGLPTIALRMPAHPIARAVLQAVGVPLAAPSANRSNAVSPTRPEHVARSFGDNAPPILDGGACEAGLESTIVAVGEGWRLLRPGPISAEDLTLHLGAERPATHKSRGATIEAPGQMRSHYSPGKPVRLDAYSANTGEFLIGFGNIEGDICLSPGGDLAEAAAQLYKALHLAAASSAPGIAVAPIPDTGMGAAINDRLRRAAA